jgi:hypothetical protein
MNDARRYRLNAAECLSAAQRCTPPYRGLALDMATSWLALAHQTEAEDELITIWNKADAAAFAAAIPRRAPNMSSMTLIYDGSPPPIGQPRRDPSPQV